MGLLLGLVWPDQSVAQSAFNTCSAAFLGNKIVVNAHTTNGQCRLPNTAIGELTVQTVELSPTGSKPLEKIQFKVAIRDNRSHTLRMYSGETFRQLPVQRVLANCQKGDYIVLLTVDSRYALPHHEILVQ